MADHVPFLKAILDHPSAPGPMGVYADWLEDHGDMELAEYVRLSLQNTEKTNWRAQAMLRRHRNEWLGPLATHTAGQTEVSSDGILSFCFTHPTLKFLKRLNDAVGIPRVPHSWGAELTDLRHYLSEFLANPNLGWLTYLDDPWSSLDCCKALLACEQLTNLRELRLRSPQLDDGFCRQLASTAHLAKLRILVLNRTNITEEGLHTLLDARRLSGLRHLTLLGGALRGRMQSSLKHSSKQPQLEHLAIRNTRLGDHGVAWLAEWQGLRSLRELDLQRCQIGPEGVASLARSAHLTNLVRLDLCGNPIGDAGLRALAEAPFLSRLDRLDVNSCDVSESGALALLAAPKLPHRVAILGNRGLDPIPQRQRRWPRRFTY